jgi:hypothetical protein
MAEAFMDRPLSFKIMVVLALVQGVGGLLRALNWVQIGVDLFGQGVLLLPFIGAIAIMRGLLISIIALLYLLSVLGALLRSRWAWWVCLTAVVINLLLVLSAVAQGAAVREVIVWSAIPVILIFYLFSQSGRDALKSA